MRGGVAKTHPIDIPTIDIPTAKLSLIFWGFAGIFMAMRRSARLSSIGLSESQDSVGYFNTRFSLNTFLKKVRRLTGDQRKAIERTGFGNLLEIPNQTLNKNLLVELMRRWDVEKHYMVLPCGEIHITLKDVALILGLRVIGAPVLLDDNESFIDLESEFNGSVWKRNVTVASLETRLDSFGGICNDDFIRTFLLYTFGTFLFPNANDKVDTRYLTFLKNVDNIGSYAWGAAVLEHLIKWLDKRKDMDVKYVGGCLLFLQIWSFEHIDIARPALLDSSVAFPRVCQWDNAKCNNKEHLVSKFKNLEYSQVTWELQLTSWESEIDMIKELLEEQSKGKEPSEAENSSVDCPIVTDNNLETTWQLVNQVVIVVETESETSPISGRQCEQEVNLDSPTESMCEVLTDVIECCSTPTFLSKQQKRANVVARSKNSNSILIEDEEDMRTRVQMLEEQIMELEKENHKLRRENELLQIQQSSGSQLEENNSLKSEIDALRREHEILSIASNSLVVRLEKILLDENTDIDEESHPIPTQD